MAEEKKSFYRRAVDYLQAPPQRQLKGLNYNQSVNSALDSAVFGYNTSSGSFPSQLIDDIGEGFYNVNMEKTGEKHNWFKNLFQKPEGAGKGFYSNFDKKTN